MPSPNPGGLTKEQRQARDLFNARLSTPEAVNEVFERYWSALRKGNTAVLLDAVGRIAGRPSSLEHHEPLNEAAAFKELTLEELRALAQQAQPALTVVK
jgi:hypothetical protein